MTDPVLADNSSKTLSPRPNEASFAVFLSWVCPGLGHFYLGQVKRGITVFLSINLLFLAGVYFAGAGIFSLSTAAFRPNPPMAILPILMPIPEILNLGATAISAFFYLPESVFWSMDFYPWARLGFCLSAISGILSLFAMVDVWTLAKDGFSKESQRKTFAVVLSWFLPGSGHFYLGQRFKAVIFFLCVNVIFFIGIWLGEGLVVSREKYVYYWAGQFLNGGSTIIGTLRNAGDPLQKTMLYFDLGLLYTTVSGLLNVVTMMSAYVGKKQEVKE